MDPELERKYRRMRQALNLQRPDRMPFSGDWGNIEYRKEVYHLGEPEFVEHMGEVVVSQNGKRRYTRDGGVWDVGNTKYEAYEDVLAVDPLEFEVEEVGPAISSSMAGLYAQRAETCFPTPWHYGTLVTRAVLEFG